VAIAGRVGSAHDGQELPALKAAASERLVAGQAELDLGLAGAAGSGQLAHHVVTDELPLGGPCTAYEALTFDAVTQGDNVFRDIVVARIIEPTSRADWLRVLPEVGVATPSYATVNRRLPMYVVSSWRQLLAAACAAPAGLGRRGWQT
jgi:hypothetical protein